MSLLDHRDSLNEDSAFINSFTILMNPRLQMSIVPDNPTVVDLCW